MSMRFKRSNEALFATVGADVVALNVQNGRAYGMENVTVAVWNLLAEPLSVESICERLIEEYDVEPDVCRLQIEQLMDQLSNEGLIEALPS